MEWTKETPTRSGIYVYRSGRWLDPECLRVMAETNKPPQVAHMGGGVVLTHDASTLSGYWFGPLPDYPKEATE